MLRDPGSNELIDVVPFCVITIPVVVVVVVLPVLVDRAFGSRGPGSLGGLLGGGGFGRFLVDADGAAADNFHVDFLGAFPRVVVRGWTFAMGAFPAEMVGLVVTGLLATPANLPPPLLLLLVSLQYCTRLFAAFPSILLTSSRQSSPKSSSLSQIMQVSRLITKESGIPGAQSLVEIATTYEKVRGQVSIERKCTLEDLRANASEARSKATKLYEYFDYCWLSYQLYTTGRTYAHPYVINDKIGKHYHQSLHHNFRIGFKIQLAINKTFSCKT